MCSSAPSVVITATCGLARMFLAFTRPSAVFTSRSPASWSTHTGVTWGTPPVPTVARLPMTGRSMSAIAPRLRCSARSPGTVASSLPGGSLGRQLRQELVEGARERSDALGFEGRAHVGHVDAGSPQRVDVRARLLDLRLPVERAPDRAVVFEAVDRLLGEGGDGVRSDQGVDVAGVGVGR